MANSNDFDSLISAARESQEAEQAERLRAEQQCQQAAEKARARTLEDRQRTLAMAEYAARLLVAHGVAPTVQLQRQLPQTGTLVRTGIFRRQQWWPDPVRYEAVAEGWPLIHGVKNMRLGETPGQAGMYGGDSRPTPIYEVRVQGLILAADGRLVQYSEEPNQQRSGIVLIREAGQLRADPNDDIVIWNYRAHSESTLLDISINADTSESQQTTDCAKHNTPICNGRNIEEELKWRLAQLVARSQSGHEAQQ